MARLKRIVGKENLLISWIRTKLKRYRSPDLIDAATALVKLDEILKIKPELEDRFSFTLADYVCRMRSEYGTDIVTELLSTPAIGELTIEQHARKLVQVYAKSEKFRHEAWLEHLLPEIESIAEKLSAAYGK